MLFVMHDSNCFTLLMQEHTPMTEDMLLEQATVLAKLGTSEKAARVRAKMQSSSLVPAGTLPEPAIDTLLNRMKKVLTNLLASKKNTYHTQLYNALIMK